MAFKNKRWPSVNRSIVFPVIALTTALLCFNCYGDDSAQDAQSKVEPSATNGSQERGISRFLDRQYYLDSGIELPDKFGVSAFLSHSKSDLPISNLKFSFDEDDPLISSPIVTMDDLANEITNSGAIVDYWILPFLDIYTILGYSDGEMDTAVNIPGSSQPIPITFTGTSYAFGAQTIFGYKSAFMLLDYNYMKLDTTAYEKKIPVSNIAARAGWKFDRRWLPELAWVSYINTTFEGSFDLIQTVGDGLDPGSVPPGTTAVYLSFEVEEYDTWAVGAQWKISNNFRLITELGFDTVTSLTAALSYRFDGF
ncbi:MAG: hypothetical protein V7746_02135 [Halioglobus sp.]